MSPRIDNAPVKTYSKYHHALCAANVLQASDPEWFFNPIFNESKEVWYIDVFDNNNDYVGHWLES